MTCIPTHLLHQDGAQLQRVATEVQLGRVRQQRAQRRHGHFRRAA